MGVDFIGERRISSRPLPSTVATPEKRNVDLMASWDHGYVRTALQDSKPAAHPVELGWVVDDVVRAAFERRARAFRLRGILDD